MDEAAFYLLAGRAHSYAPRGDPAVLGPHQSFEHLSVASGITMAGKLYTQTDAHALESLDSVGFLLHLLTAVKRKLLVIWDGGPSHQGEVHRFMREIGSKFLYLETLPPYAPELNPDEGVWEQLKHVELANVTCQSIEELRGELALAIDRLQHKPHLVRSFFGQAKLSL